MQRTREYLLAEFHTNDLLPVGRHIVIWTRLPGPSWILEQNTGISCSEYSLCRNADHHLFLFVAIKKLKAVLCPNRRSSSLYRNLGLSSWTRKLLNINFGLPRLVRLVGEPLAIRRKNWRADVEIRLKVGVRLAISFQGKNPDLAIGRFGKRFVNQE